MVKVNKTLNDILSGIKVKEVIGDMDTHITGVSMDSREIDQGDLFVCVPGFNMDGHDFAAAALEKGAVALVVERFLPFEVPQIMVENVRNRLGVMASEIYDHPSQKLEVVGVTGTNGKTTITHLVEKIGIETGRKVGLIGTLGARINGREIPGSRTTPEAVDIQKLLAEMVEEQVSLAVMEVSSHALDLGRVNQCEFDAGIFTNLTQDHLDYHKSMEEYLKAKSLLFQNLKGQKSGKLAVINGDDPAFGALSRSSAAPVISYGIKGNVDYKAEAPLVTAQGVEFTVKFKGQEQKITYSTPGIFSVYNALAAFAWSVEKGCPPEKTAAALAAIRGVPGRFESVQAGQPFQVIVDYAHTPDGLVNVLRTAKEFTEGKLITVFGCGGDRDRTKRPIMGRVASQLSDFVYVTSDNPRTEEPDFIIKEILAGVSAVDYTAIADRKEAIQSACKQAQKGDTILIAGKGHETYQIIGTTVNSFDDREIAREALRRLGYETMD